MKVTYTFRRLDNNRENGVTMVLVAAAMVAIIGMAAMSIDLVTLYLAREEAQRTADTAALAAARIISVSGITGTASPTKDTTDWSSICSAAGGWATQAAVAVAAQNTIGGQSVPVVSVTYSDGSTTSNDCTTLSDVFAVNPMVTVQITPSVTIPSFFSRIWGSTGNQISASATAEAFNPSQSDTHVVGASGSVTPVQPHCVKPWIVPNLDPGNCPPVGACRRFVSNTDGSIRNPGIAPGGAFRSSAVIGETFNLFADCLHTGAPCGIVDSPLKANVAGGTYEDKGPPSLATFPNLEYLPAADPVTSVGYLSSCTGTSKYQEAVAGCDQTTAYQCGVQVSAGGTNTIDLNENPGGAAGDTATGLACSLTHSATVPLSGQDIIIGSNGNPYPFVAIAQDVTSKAMGVPVGTPLTSSNSIVSLPIYDSSSPLLFSNNTAPVTIVGFLQVFVNSVDQNDGSVNVTVLNVAGCGTAATNAPVSGSSPVPVRLITPPPPPSQ